MMGAKAVRSPINLVAPRNFVVTDAEQTVGAYYSLAAGTVAHQAAARAIQDNKSDPLPVMVLARMAVGTRAQGIKLAAALRQNAVNRAVAVSQNAEVGALLAHPLNDRTRQFYERCAFQSSPAHPMTLILRLSNTRCRYQ